MENVIQNYFEEHIGINDTKISKTKIYLKDIVYIEFEDRKTVLHFLSGKKLVTSYPLKHWIETLPTHMFGQPHKSFLVNLKYIDHFTQRDILLKNNETIPLSRHFKKGFEDNYMISLHRFL